MKKKVKRDQNVLLIVDSVINIFLGLVLIAYSEPVIKLFGLPSTDNRFYPTLLGAILFGIGLALWIEYKRIDSFSGLGLGGAICINLAGGIMLGIWLASGYLDVPVKGLVILWIVALVVLGLSVIELLAFVKNRHMKNS